MQTKPKQRLRNSGQQIDYKRDQMRDYNAVAYILATEELFEFFHATVYQVLFAKVLSEGHVGELRLLFLYLEQPSLDRVFDDQLDCRYGLRLTEAVLHQGSYQPSPEA
jgi:hypothetical protein